MNSEYPVHDSSPSAGFRTIGIAAIILYGLLYIAPLGVRPLFVPDEYRYAEIAREMVAGGDWFELRQAGLPYYEKPPFGYWLNALSVSILGHNGFAVRLSSALSAGLSALAIFILVHQRRKHCGRALTAAIVYLSCVQVFGIATFTVLDSMFSLFVCLSMVLFFLAEGRTGGGKAALLTLSGIACGAAFMTKGFTALVIPALAIVAWLLWERRFKELASIWLLPVAAAGAIVLPFALALHNANPGFWNYFFWVEHVQRFLEPSGGQHGQPFWFFLPVLAIGGIPWSFFALPIVTMVRRHAAIDSLTRYCICWGVTSFLFFSACGGKLPTYILPCFPALAVLTADALFEYPKGGQLRLCCLIGAATLAAAVVVFLGWLYVSSHSVLREHLASDEKTILLGAAVFAGSICLVFAGRKFTVPGKRSQAVAMAAFSLCGMCAASFFFLPEAVEDRRSPSRLLDAVVQLTPRDALIVTDRVTLPSACWHYGRDDVLFYGEQGELGYGVEHSNTFERYAPTVDDADAIIQHTLEKGRPVAIVVQEPDPLLSHIMKKKEPDEVRKLSRFTWVLYKRNENIPRVPATGWVGSE